jgi:CDP-diacylglycerol--glycerol-3-phosphate 3-phosphatidyltransferase
MSKGCRKKCFAPTRLYSGKFMQKKDIFTISNGLSFIRIFFVFPIIHYISHKQNIIVLLIAVVTMITDLLDGYFARKFNQITILGKVLDPLADKIVVAGGFIALTLYQDFPWWITGIIITRDLFIMIGSVIIFSHKKYVVPSNIPGKITVTLISILAFFYLLNIKIFIIPLIILVLAMILISAINYSRVFLKNIINKL